MGDRMIKINNPNILLNIRVFLYEDFDMMIYMMTFLI